jgi:hypothetical protein
VRKVSKEKEKKRNSVQGGEKIKLQKKTEIRAEKGQRDRKENPTSAPSIHIGALVGAASLWPYQPPYTSNNFLW